MYIQQTRQRTKTNSNTNNIHKYTHIRTPQIFEPNPIGLVPGPGSCKTR